MLKLSTDRLKKGLYGICSMLQGRPWKFDRDKKLLIDHAFTNVIPGAKSFADLGGVWRIDGAYSFYVLEKFEIENGFLVDTNFTEAVLGEAKRHGNLRLIEGNFGSSEVLRQIGAVDAILLFDVLLHQVQPDWDVILGMYAAVTKCFVVFNQQCVASQSTIRLPDLGAEKYFTHVKMDRNDEGYRQLFETPNVIHPQHQRPWRDVHNVWQWGITDDDLVGTMRRLGFELKYTKNYGQFSSWSSFENHAFVFLKR